MAATTEFEEYIVRENPEEWERSVRTKVSVENGTVSHYVRIGGRWVMTSALQRSEREKILKKTDPFWDGITLALDRPDRERRLSAVDRKMGTAGEGKKDYGQMELL